jgi:hypothetical protein
MQLIERKFCAVLNNADLEPLYNFPLFPVFMGCTNQPESSDLKQDMLWSISRSSGLIQLNKLLPLDILYQESHGAGAIGTIWKKHHEAFAKFLYQLKPSSIFEIGGSHGILSKEYQQLKKISWTILEPNPSPVDACEARFIKGFFDESFNYSYHFDTVVHSHVFEHVYNPDAFMQHLSNFMNFGKKLVFSLPNLEVMLQKKYNNCINFEHTIFLTESYVEFLLAKHGFKLISKEYFMDDHSIFYAAERHEAHISKELPQGLYEKNKKVFMDYIAYYKVIISDLNYKLNQTNQPVYLFGAHVFAQYLIQMGLETKAISNLLDNDKNKWGKRLYGTKLIVMPPKILHDVKDPIVILRAGVYNNEIKKDIIENINSSVVFFE